MSSSKWLLNYTLTAILPIKRIFQLDHISKIKYRQLHSSMLMKMSGTSSRSSSNGHFSYLIDRWMGITINSEEQYCDKATFKQKLEYSLPEWINEGVRTIWFQISVKHSKWIPILTDSNFIFHRVTNSGMTVIMFRWLSIDSPSHIPPAAHTTVGVGGIVLNSKDEILVVQENYMAAMHWKLPGGLVEFNEDLTSASIREVMEETGIETEFKSCVSFRHMHDVSFGFSDIYFIVHLKAMNSDIKIDNREIVAAQWMNIGDYLKNENIHKLNKMFVKIFLDNRNQNISVIVQEGLHPVIKKPYSLYLPTISLS